MAQRNDKPAVSRGRKPAQRALGPKKAADKKKGGKLTSVKNQIRAINRLLAKGLLTPNAAAEQQRRLEQLADTQEKHQLSERARKNATKYHKVRFFERVKLERQITQLERQPAGDSKTAAAERAAHLARLRDDLLYVTHFPKEEKYVSILKQSEDPQTQPQLDAERLRLRALVHARLADAAMVAEPDEGRSLAYGGGAAAPQAADAASDSDQDDFFLASDNDDGGGAGAASPAEPAAQLPASSTAEPQTAKGGKQRQRPPGVENDRGKRKVPRAQQQSAALKRPPHSKPPAGASSAKRQQQRQPEVQQAQKAQRQQHRHGKEAPTQPNRWSVSAAPQPGPAVAQAAQRPEKAAAAKPGAFAPLRLPADSRPKLHIKPPGSGQPKAPKADVKPQPPKEGEPLRKRAEGGRKRRKKT